MRIMITGASGEIGRPLISRLTGQQHELHAISRVERPADHKPVKWIHADIRDPESLAIACRCKPQVVVHMAAVTHSTTTAAYETVNVQGTANLIDALSNVRPSRLILLSSRAIGKLGGAYSASKERAEQLVKRSDLPWTILRPGEIYGTGGHDPIMSLASDLRQKRYVPVLGDGLYKLCPVFSEDVVEALIRAIKIETEQNKTYVLAGPEELTYLQLIEKLERLQGLPKRRQIRVPIAAGKILIGGLSMLRIGRFVPDQIPRLLLEKSTDSSAAKNDLQFKPRPLEHTIPPLLNRQHPICSNGVG